jgi:chorismate mutase
MAQGRALHPSCSSLSTWVRLDLESSRLRAIDAALVRMIDERVTTGLRIGALQSKIGRPRTSSDRDDAWGRKVLENHAEA